MHEVHLPTFYEIKSKNYILSMNDAYRCHLSNREYQTPHGYSTIKSLLINHFYLFVINPSKGCTVENIAKISETIWMFIYTQYGLHSMTGCEQNFPHL